ncbi:hypothetical protein [uncultured Psychroserpens sp.]|uniref:hypothetical protein n=1 Tax=uncultured Psychroserpens sp. TaxID=255436 RepID=UPI002617AF57|nr:hypothetical protein [uncultured Psychroserpens sp.]
MTTFKDLKSQWEKQPEQNTPKDGPELIVQKMNILKRKQGIANFVLLTTVLVLIGFFFYIEAHNNATVTLALLLMISALLIRVIIEFFSIKKLKEIDITENSSVFSSNMISYYKKRIRTHYIVTPIIIILYCAGFIMLLPSFKDNLSSGFYIYIKSSAIVVLLLMVLFIRKQIKKELIILKGLSN